MNAKNLKLGLERSSIRELFEYGKRLQKEVGAENVFDFSIGNPSSPAPACVKEEIIRLLNEVPAAELHGYTSAQGDPAAREAVASYLNKTYGANTSARLVYMTCGAAASLTMFFNAILTGGEEVLVLTPYFPEYRVFIEGAGGVLKEVATDENFRLDLQAIEAAINENTAAIILNSPNNPTGVVYREEELQGLSALLERKSKELSRPVYLVSDEPYRELVYGTAVPYTANYYPDTVVCYSFSKSLSLAGERIGYIALNEHGTEPDKLYAAITGAGRSLGFVCAPALFQRTVAKCLGRTADTALYNRNRTLFMTGLREIGYDVVEPEGAFYLFVKSPLASAQAFSDCAKKYGLLIVPSDGFGIKGYVRISYCVPTERIERALPKFKELFNECK